MEQLEVLTDDPAVLIDDSGSITAVGRRTELQVPEGCLVEEVEGVLFPGFVDSHTHSVFGAARTADHERRARGVSYKDIAAAGGGILSSVRSVRGMSQEDLRVRTESRLRRLLSLGTTTVEVKSGYGLDLSAELKQLQVIDGLKESGPSLIPTFLGAHEVPEEYRPRSDDYVDLVVNEMIPAVRDGRLARFCDVFCEPGVFSVDQSRVVLRAALAVGMGIKLHADELDGSGGAELGAELGATSVDHLAAISPEGISALVASDTVAVMLPGTMMFLGRREQAPAREIVDRGGAVALATDFNPGSSPGLSLPLMATMAVSQL
ncbi:MAG: imidazolonepropionase, partial [Gemmatimonadales bacterium]